MRFQTLTKVVIAKVVIEITGGIKSTDPTLAAADAVSKADAVRHTITLTEPVDTEGVPTVVSVQRLRPGSQTVVAAFQEVRIKAEPFNVRIVLTAPPHGIDLADVNNLVEVEFGTVSDLVIGVPFTRIGVGQDASTQAMAGNTLRPHPIEGMYEHLGTGPLQGVPNTVIADNLDDTVPMANTVDDMYRQYRVTITPDKKSADFDVKIRIKSFHDNGAVLRKTYVTPGYAAEPNGRDVLRVPVLGTPRDLTAGYRVILPKDIVIPAGGYLVITQNSAGSEIVVPNDGDDDHPESEATTAPNAVYRTPVEMLYNVSEQDTLPNLATQFRNGVVVDLESQHPGLVISEVMWGEDTSLATSSNSQYIELYNPGAVYTTIDDLDNTADTNEALTLIFYAPNEFDAIPEPEEDSDSDLPAGVTDRIGTLDADGDYWSPQDKGASGRSGTLEGADGELTIGRGEFVDAVPIVSMYRGWMLLVQWKTVKWQRIGRHLRVPKVLTLIRVRLVSDMVRRVRRQMLPQRLQIPRLN